MDINNAIEVRSLSKYFKIVYDKPNTLKERIVSLGKNKKEKRIILKNINLNIKKGETVALIGTNGCGKSTLLKLMTKILYPNEGFLKTNGKLTSLLELGAGFHPDFTGRENIYFNASIFGLTKKEIDARLNEIIEFSELQEFIDNPIRTYSSGMYMRLAFSIAINVDAEILLIDEILAVGDQRFQDKCFDKLMELKNSNKTIVIVSHSLDTVKKLCDRAIWIYKGEIHCDGDPTYVIKSYLNKISEDHKMKRIEKKENLEAKNFKGILAIDNPSNFATLKKGEDVLFYGWEMSEDDKSNVKLYIDEQELEDVIRVDRPDVLVMYDEQYGGSETNDLVGWESNIGPHLNESGEHILKARVIDRNDDLICEREVLITME